MLFFEGRYPRYAFPVFAEYIRPNEYPRKLNSPCGTLQIRVFSTGSAGNIKSEPSSGDRSACTILDEISFQPGA
jgi:hypothetical protein